MQSPRSRQGRCGAADRQSGEQGLFDPPEHPADGRSQLLFATEKAEGLKHSKAHVETLFYEWLLLPLSEEQRQTFAGLLEILYLRCKAESKADFPEVARLVKEETPHEA